MLPKQSGGDAVVHIHKLVCETSEDCDDRKVLGTGAEPPCRDMKSWGQDPKRLKPPGLYRDAPETMFA